MLLHDYVKFPAVTVVVFLILLALLWRRRRFFARAAAGRSRRLLALVLAVVVVAKAITAANPVSWPAAGEGRSGQVLFPRSRCRHGEEPAEHFNEVEGGWEGKGRLERGQLGSERLTGRGGW